MSNKRVIQEIRTGRSSRAEQLNEIVENALKSVKLIEGE